MFGQYLVLTRKTLKTNPMSILIMTIRDAALVHFIIFSGFLCPNTPSVFQEFNSEPGLWKLPSNLRWLGEGVIYI